MKIQYFEDTDTLYVELRACHASETKDLDRNTVIDLDENREICAFTIEHASGRANMRHFSFEHLGRAAVAG